MNVVPPEFAQWLVLRAGGCTWGAFWAAIAPGKPLQTAGSFGTISCTATVQSRSEDLKQKKYYYSSGEFAKLSGINKRTLHYYNDIGLFCPAVTGENGYHYYSCFQFAQLELILTLRRVGLSIEDIRRYTGHPSNASFTQIAAEKKKVIDRSIEQLLQAKVFLQQKLDRLDLGMAAEHGKVELITLPEQRILLSKPTTGTFEEADFAIAADFSMRLRKLFGLFDNFGSRVSLCRAPEQPRYDCFFAYGREDVAVYDELRPAGTYLRAFCIGGWEKIHEIYGKIFAFARENQVELSEYAYEEGMNEISLEKSDDYITMITIGCRETGND